MGEGRPDVSDLKRRIVEFSRECGADLVGFADVDRFRGMEERHHPRTILPEAASVIGFAFRVLRGSFRGVEEGSTFFQYTTTGVEIIEETYMPIALCRIAGFIEDSGYLAAIQKRHQLIMNAINSTNPEMEHGSIHRGVPGEYQLDFARTAALCGLGEIGLSGSVLTDPFGPFQRLAFILTNAPLEPDDMTEPHLCNRCGDCLEACPGHAFSSETVDAPCGGRSYPVRPVDAWQCAAYYKGANAGSNPFMAPEAFAGFPDREDILAGRKALGETEARKVIEDLAYCYPPGRHRYVVSICGRACDRACYAHLEQSGKLTKRFHHPFRKKAPWRLTLPM
jgi:epoxyqueuosine reductase